MLLCVWRGLTALVLFIREKGSVYSLRSSDELLLAVEASQFGPGKVPPVLCRCLSARSPNIFSLYYVFAYHTFPRKNRRPLPYALRTPVGRLKSVQKQRGCCFFL